jgi:hypothetical protein
MHLLSPPHTFATPILSPPGVRASKEELAGEEIEEGDRGGMGGVTLSVVAKMAFPSMPSPEDTEAGVTTLSGQPHQENVEVLRLRTRKGNCQNPPIACSRASAAAVVEYSQGRI